MAGVGTGIRSWALLAALAAPLQGAPTASVDERPTLAPLAAWDRVARQVRERLASDEVLRGERIGVSASGLVVTLTGRVHSRGLADRAVELARRAAAPQMMVADELQVEEAPVGDDLLAQSVAERLAALNRSAIVVSVDGGLVVLTGIARTQREREQLVQAVEQTAGVGAVIDRIAVRPAPDGGVAQPPDGGR
jgi:osmotically-inducible protein OsmY